MNIKTFSVREYRGCKVYLRNFADCFEYLTVLEKEIYTAHIRVKPHPISLILYYLGFEKEKYSYQIYQKIGQQLNIMAEATIDYILGVEGGLIKK